MVNITPPPPKNYSYPHFRGVFALILAFLLVFSAFSFVGCTPKKDDKDKEIHIEGGLKASFTDLFDVYKEISQATNLTVVYLNYDEEFHEYHKEEAKLTENSVSASEFVDDEAKPQEIENIWITTKVQDEILGFKYFQYSFNFNTDSWERQLVSKGDFDDQITYAVKYYIEALKEVFLSESFEYHDNFSSSFGQGSTYIASNSLLEQYGYSSFQIHYVGGKVIVELSKQSSLERQTYTFMNFGTTTVAIPTIKGSVE